jgi:hypothetical protein
MKQYENVSPSIQILIENYCQEDEYGLQPKTLYNNIANSLQSGRVDKVAEIFDVSLSLCEMIQEENQNDN